MQDRKIKVIIVDDEESARNILSNLLSFYTDKLDIVAICKNAMEAKLAIEAHNPDCVFLDIEMPNFNGFELLGMLDKINFDVIFITAYQQFALKAFEVSAFDYLLKPIEINRLNNSIQLLMQKKEKDLNAIKYQLLTESLEKKSINKMIVNQKGVNKILEFKNIAAFEAQEAYTYIYENGGGKITMSKNLKYFENLVNENEDFFRVHKSWVINKQYVLRYNSVQFSILLAENIIAKLSKYRKSEFEEWLAMS